MDSSITPHLSMLAAGRREKSRVLTKIGLIMALIIAAMTILAPLVYLVGLGYYEGSLQPFGVDSSFFPLTTQQYFSQAFFALADGIARILGSWLVVIVSAIAVLRGLFKFIDHPDFQLPIRQRRIGWIIQWRLLWIARPLEAAVAGAFNAFAFSFSGMFVLLLVVILPPLVAYQQGVKVSNRQVAAHTVPCAYH